MIYFVCSKGCCEVLQVNRDNNLKIPKKIEILEKNVNNIDDLIATKEANAYANDEKFDYEKVLSDVKKIDNDVDVISKIPFNSNDLMVITVVKKLGAYVIAITEKSPKKYRGVFVNRMQNYCLDTLEFLLQANFISLSNSNNKIQRENYQKKAIIKLKLLGYTSMLALNANCILKKQYKQISMQLSEAINLISAWKKSDDKRFKRIS